MKGYQKIWVVLMFVWASVYAARVVFSPSIPQIMRDLSLNYALMGLASSAIFYSYFAMQFVAGLLGSRFGRRLMLLYGTGISGIGVLLTSFATNIASLMTYRILTGVGQGLIFSNDRSIIAHLTPSKSIGLGQGLSFSGVGLGFVIGVLGGGVLVATLGWRETFQLIALLGAASFAIVLLIVREPPRKSERTTPLLSMMRDKEFGIILLGGIPLHYNFWVLSTWLPTALIEARIADLTSASAITALIGAAAPIGLITIGKLTDIAYSRGWGGWLVTSVMSSALSLATSLLTLEYSMRSELNVVTLTTFVAGFAIWGAWAPFYAMVSRMFPGGESPVAFGLMNGVHFVGSLISPYVTGYLRDLYADFTLGLFVASIAPLVTSLLFFISKPEGKGPTK